MHFHIGLNARRTNAESWGDLAFARSLAAGFVQTGHAASLFFRDEQPDLTGQRDVVLRLIGPHLDEPVPGVPNLLWMISPPNLAPLACLARYQALFLASPLLVSRCLAQGLHATYLPQATDSGLFNPAARGDQPVDFPADLPADLPISFVGNHAPRAPRLTVRAALDLGFDVRIWGQGWDGVVPARHLCGTRLDSAELAQVYARSRIVLNTHMPYMAELGFMNNRSFDALACGAQVVSDPVAGFADPRLPALHQTDAGAGLGPLLNRLLARAPTAQDRARIAESVTAGYSFIDRALTFAQTAEQLLQQNARARPAFAPLPPQPRRGAGPAITLSDVAEGGEDSAGFEAMLDALLAQAQPDVTLQLSDPTTTPPGLSVEQAMRRAALAVWRIGAVVAREAGFTRLAVVPPPRHAHQGTIHAVMHDHRSAQAAAINRKCPAAHDTLGHLCSRARRLLESPAGQWLELAHGEDGIDPVQTQIRLLTNRPLYAHTPAGFSRDRQKQHLRLWPRRTLARSDVSVGVFVHLYYPDLAPVFRDRFAALDLPHRLYVSTDTTAKADQIRACLPMAEVRVLPNRGRDVFGKLFGFADAHAAHDIVLHLHGKKSPHFSGFDQWLDHCLTCLLPNREEVFRILSLFQSLPDLGVVAPLTYRSVLAAAHWGDNLDIAREIAARALPDLALPPDGQLDFPVGSMFWARRAALQPLLDLGLTAGHFPPESGQVDATPAHAIERLFGVICQAGGYRLIRVAPAASVQHKGQQIIARRNEDVRRALQSGRFDP
ncbi:MAG: rhamnan synthesis F family protein [Pseudotabrizicola sp.]|uniref:rhamnan synthesis F family protein n=1 Tax=Pseudotabrizicola sp. TaxID=2939647 RepID=UPI00271C1723|nr:rhamnan synthesis F family protein [Pseudotabrizicola sp.]MDO9637331.1 rhamnan synthesis F family protein [Pseudotabrizicola sp.]